jgi:glycosyltransferase involved in cell wall biosynthesis
MPDTIPGTISIIITTYNGEKYIRETIASVQRQTFKHWELIIVDDGSTDHTVDIIRSITDDRINLIGAGRVGRNGQLKNRAIRCSSGEYIAFIDHDDLWAPLKLQRQIEALQADDNAAFCLCNGYNFKTVDQPIGYFFKQTSGIKRGDTFLSFFNGELSAFTQTLLVRKSCVVNNNWFEEGDLSSDPEFVLNLAGQYPGVILFEPMVFHRKHEQGFSVINWIQFHEQGLQLIRKYVREKRLPKRLGREILFRSNIDFGEKYLAQYRRQKAIAQFAQAWINKPFSWVPPRKILKALIRAAG